MDTTISQFRMSLFWTARFATLVNDTVPAHAPLATLGSIPTYAPFFARLAGNPGNALNPADAAPALELPWKKGTVIHWFWARYLNANPIQRVNGNFAFVRLVPFRRHDAPAPGLTVTLPETLAAPGGLDVKANGEALFHAHMVTFATHFTVKGRMSPEQMAKACLALRHERVLSERDAAAGRRKLDEVAASHLEQIYLEAVGAANAQPLPPSQPFSIVTVLQGNAAGGAPVQGDAVHVALEAVTQWPKQFEATKVALLAEGRISSRPVPPELPLLFGQRRSRAVWDPVAFSRHDPDSSSLSCYHRNLFIGTLQVEALMAFARMAEEEANMHRRPKAIHDCEDPVLKRIVALHRGDTETYRSESLRRFIDEHPLRPSVDALSQRIGSSASLPALAH